MAKLMGAKRRSINLGELEAGLDDKAYRAGSLQALDRSPHAYEDAPLGATRATTLNIGSERFTNLWRKWKLSTTTRLAGDAQLARAPRDIIE